MASTSSFTPLSSFCLGSSFLLKASKSRWPSLVAKIACSTLIVPILVLVALVATGAEALLAAGLGAAGNAAFWASAATDTASTAGIKNRANFVVMWLI